MTLTRQTQKKTRGGSSARQNSCKGENNVNSTEKSAGKKKAVYPGRTRKTRFVSVGKCRWEGLNYKTPCEETSNVPK